MKTKKIKFLQASIIAIIYVIMLCLMAVPVAAMYNFDGWPVETRTNGTVNGGVFIDCEPWAGTEALTGNFNVPDGDIKWAQLYTGIWGGTEDYEGWVYVVFNEINDKNGLGPIHLRGENDVNPNVWCSGNGKYWMYYDVADLVNAGAVNTATTTKINATVGNFDGRVYGIVLVVVYEGGANPKNIQYWINDGSDDLNYDIAPKKKIKSPNSVRAHNDGTTDFAGSVADSVTDAELTMVHLTAYEPPCDNCLQFNGAALDTSMVDSNTFELNSWDVASHVESSGNDAWYSRGGDGYINVCNAILTLESEELPDLIVEKSVEIGPDGKFIVSYTVTNIGGGDAGPSTTCKYVDGELQETQLCPALASDESHSGAFAPEKCACGETLNVTVCVDKDNDVDESDETNNCKVNIVECPYIEVDLRADGIASNILDATGYSICPSTVTEDGVTIDNETAMGALVIYCQNSGINIHITIGTWGEYVVQIGNDPTDNNSWSYAVNEEVPPIGGAQKVIFDGDRVHWYNYNLNYYSVLTALDKSAIYVGETLTATVTGKNMTGIHFLNGASVHVGAMGPWGPEPGPSVGITGVDGTCTFPWSTVGTWGVYANDSVHGSGISNYPPVSFTCSKEEKPDLGVKKKWEIWAENVAARLYTVSYVIFNNGTAIAPRGHNSTLYVDSVEIEHKLVPVDLAPGDNYTDTFDTVIECTGNFDTINVCVDNDNVVDELNETNNCLENVWPSHCPAEIAVYRADVPNADGILNALRTQRDENLKDEYVDRYYDKSPELAKVIGRDSALTIEAARLLSKYSPMLSQDAHRIDVDTLITKRDVKEIESFIGRFKESVLNNRDGISADSTEELINFLDEFEKQVEASEGKTFSDALHDSIYYKNEQMPSHENEGYLYTPL